jgi:hypothetical protein
MDRNENFLDELMLKLSADKQKIGSWQRFPIRFILLSSYQDLKQFIDRMTYLGVIKTELVDQLIKKDGWLSHDKIKRLADSLSNDKDSMIVGISELARFYSKTSFDTLIFSLLDIENRENKLRRIYIPLVGLDSVILGTLNKYHRKTEYTPYIKTESPVSIFSFYITELKINKDFDECILVNTTDWLNFWKKKENLCQKVVVCSSETLNYWYKNVIPDNVFIMDQIANFKELLYKLKNISIPIEYKDEEEVFWEKLVKENFIKDDISFEYILQKTFNISKLTDEDIIRFWYVNSDNFKKWLLKAYVLYSFKDTYIYEVFKRLQSFDNLRLVELMWFTIFDIDEKLETICKERTRLIKESLKYIPVEQISGLEERLARKLYSLDKIKDRINIISGITNTEKAILIDMYNNNQVDKKILWDKYSHLYNYLDEVIFDNAKDEFGWINQYFLEYKTSKLIDKITPRLEKLLEEKNGSSEKFYEWSYPLKSVQEILNNEIVNRVIVIDALGVEWVSLVEKDLEDMGIWLEKKLLAKSYLPSITDINKPRIINTLWVRDLDKEIHSGHYKHPLSFINQIETLKEIIRKYIGVMENERIAIVADHGSTVFPRLFSKIYNFDEAEHEGRCMKTTKLDKDNEDFFIYQDENNEKWAICLNYSSLNNKPTRSVHGGATPEEVIVPVLILTKIQNIQRKINYRIILDKQEVSTRETTITLEISPVPLVSPKVIDEEGYEFNVTQVDNSLWTVDLKNLKYEFITIKLPDFSVNFKISHKRSMKERDLF